MIGGVAKRLGCVDVNGEFGHRTGDSGFPDGFALGGGDRDGGL